MKRSIFIFLFFIQFALLLAQPTTNKPGSKYQFTIIKNMEATDVVSQDYTGTCWSYSTLSHLESELMRMGKGKFNLSEMFVARMAYFGKATNFFRYYGTFTFGQGGAFHDIPWVIENYGIVPEDVYTGYPTAKKYHDHTKLEKALTDFVKETIKKPDGKLNPDWKKPFNDSLDKYLGKFPLNTEEFVFTYQGKSFTPKTFAQFLGLNMKDYVSLTSYTHHPFYESFILEVQDNWCLKPSYNLPIDELLEVMEHALMNGYTFSWGADVSEKGFSFHDGLAIVPLELESIKQEGKDDKYFNSPGARKISEVFTIAGKEKWVTQEERQFAFDIQETTDDHGMHATGLAKDQNGTKYLIVKNSWGKNNPCGGYFFASFPYVRYKTMNIWIHKDAIPQKIREKLKI